MKKINDLSLGKLLFINIVFVLFLIINIIILIKTPNDLLNIFNVICDIIILAIFSPILYKKTRRKNEK